MCVLISIKKEHDNDGSVEFDVMPIIHENINLLSKEGLITLTDILRGMCAVATLPPSELDVLLSIYYTNFEDLDMKRKRESSNGKEDTVIPFPGPPVTKH